MGTYRITSVSALPHQLEGGGTTSVIWTLLLSFSCYFSQYYYALPSVHPQALLGRTCCDVLQHTCFTRTIRAWRTMRMHTRWPRRLVDRGTAEIWLCWNSKWTLIEFPTVSSCDTVCPNVARWKWKGDGHAWETLFQRPLLLFWLNINVSLRLGVLLYGFDIRTKVIASG